MVSNVAAHPGFDLINLNPDCRVLMPVILGLPGELTEDCPAVAYAFAPFKKLQKRRDEKGICPGCVTRWLWTIPRVGFLSDGYRRTVKVDQSLSNNPFGIHRQLLIYFTKPMK